MVSRIVHRSIGMLGSTGDFGSAVFSGPLKSLFLSGISPLIHVRRVSSHSSTDLRINQQTLDEASAGCDLYILDSKVKVAVSGTNLRITNSKIGQAKAGTDLDIISSEIDYAQSGTDLTISDKSNIGTARAETDAKIEYSVVKALTVGTSVTAYHSQIGRIAAITLDIENSEITDRVEVNYVKRIKDSKIDQLFCSIFGNSNTVVIQGSAIDLLALNVRDERDAFGTSQHVNISGNHVSMNTSGGLFTYTNVNGQRDFWFLGIPVSKISRFFRGLIKKGTVRTNSKGPHIVVLKDSKVRKITFDSENGEVWLEGDSRVQSVEGGVVKQRSL